jgi:hypothetical protein
MRFLGLTLCLLASSFGARAQSVEDRVTALEARVKVLEEALHNQGVKPALLDATNIDGTYKATLPNGESVNVEFNKGHVTANVGKETKAGTYEITGERVIVTADGKSETLIIEGDHLRGNSGGDKIDFIKTK